MSEEEKRSDGTFTRKVERDPSFVRYYADSSTIHAIGTELEFAFLSIAPSLEAITWRQGSTQPVSVKVGPGVAELCRVRMDPEASHNLAMNILLHLASSDEVSTEALENNFNTIRRVVAERPEAQPSEDHNEEADDDI